jgi:hypothetical protein
MREYDVVRIFWMVLDASIAVKQCHIIAFAVTLWNLIFKVLV